MKSRGLVVGIAVVLAAAAAAFVLLYTNGVKTDAINGGGLSVVVVAQQDIPANTNLSPLIEQGVFSELRVPGDAVVDGAVNDLSQLRGQTSTAPILANEQIPTERLSGGTAPKGGSLGITEGHVGVPMILDGSVAGYGNVQVGDNVAIYATFGPNTVIRRVTLRQVLNPAQLEQLFALTQGGGGGQTASGSPVVVLPTSYTVTLVPSVRVIDIQNPAVDETGKSDNGAIPLTLDLTPEDAHNVIFALGNASEVRLGMLPPENPEGYATGGSFGPTFEQVVGTAK